VTDRQTDRQTTHDGKDRAVQSVARVKSIPLYRVCLYRVDRWSRHLIRLSENTQLKYTDDPVKAMIHVMAPVALLHVTDLCSWPSYVTFS